MHNLSGLDSVPNIVQQPVRTEPYIKTLGPWTVLTLDNGHSVKYAEANGTSLIMVDLDGDGRNLFMQTADQFAKHVYNVQQSPNRID